MIDGEVMPCHLISKENKKTVLESTPVPSFRLSFVTLENCSFYACWIPDCWILARCQPSMIKDTRTRFTAAHSGVIRKYRMYGVLGHLGFCLWLRHPRWPQWCVVACYVRSVSMRVWCETTTGAVVVLLMLCYGRAPLFTGFPLGKSQLTIERCLALTNHFAQLC